MLLSITGPNLLQLETRAPNPQIENKIQGFQRYCECGQRWKCSSFHEVQENSLTTSCWLFKLSGVIRSLWEWHKTRTNKKDKNHARLLAQTTLRNILGTKNLHEILSDRESISADMQVPALVNIISCDFFRLLSLFLEIYVSGGVGRGNGAVGHQSGASWDVSRCCHWCCWHHCHSVIVKIIVVVNLNLLSKDARLPVQLQRAMAAEAEAAREARAKVVVMEIVHFRTWFKFGTINRTSCCHSSVQVIAAEGEQKASKSLKEAR